jgi:hypothetical protein
VIRLGFLDYVEKIAPEASDPLFPDLEPGGADNKRGYTFSKWWPRYRRAIGLYERGLDYRSFRHSVTTKLVEADVSQASIDELTGNGGRGRAGPSTRTRCRWRSCTTRSARWSGRKSISRRAALAIAWTAATLR